MRKPMETFAETLTGEAPPKDSRGKQRGARVTVTEHHVTRDVELNVGAGSDKSKGKGTQAVSFVDLLFNAKRIDFEMWAAADRYREMHMERGGPSQGVGSYGNNPGGTDPSTKGDRVGKAMTGYSIDRKGAVRKRGDGYLPNIYDYEAATHAMCAVLNENGKWVTDQQLKDIMIAAICDTVDIMPTQTTVARLRTKYTGEKQLMAAGATVVTEGLKRLVGHFSYR